MLLLRRERFFARVAPAADGGGTVLTVASLTRGSGESAPRFAALTRELRAALDDRAQTAGTVDGTARPAPSSDGQPSRTGGSPE
jgi:cytochrome c biogenesis protein